MKLWGRIQSRVYEKKVDAETIIKKVAYEVSVTKLEASQGENALKMQNEV